VPEARNDGGNARWNLCIHDGFGLTGVSARGTHRGKSFKPPTIDIRTRLSRASSNDLHNSNFSSTEPDSREGKGIRQHVREVVIVLWVQP
jgi:hypothetical protein